MKKNVITLLIGGIVGFITGYLLNTKKHDNNTNIEIRQTNKYYSFFRILNKWMQLKEEGIKLEGYFLKKGYKRIAIYGVGHLGQHLIKELEGTKVEILYGIDRRAEDIYAEIPVYSIEEKWENVDVIVVTAITDYLSIKKNIMSKHALPIISLEDIIFGL